MNEDLPQNTVFIEPSAWQFVLDALGWKLPKGKTVRDIKAIGRNHIIFKD